MSDDIHHLFEETIRGDYEDDAPWEAVRKLRTIGTRDVFDVASQWSRSEDPLKRARGIDVVAQLGKTIHATSSFSDESFSLVTDLIQREKEIRPLSSAIAALGHLDNAGAVPIIARFRSHPSPEVRFSVACALGSFPNAPLSIETLLVLITDGDEDVRDWATFGLGSLSDADSDEVREGLLRNLEDPHKDVREEAMAGLGKRRDRRVLSSLLRALGQSDVSNCVIEAADLMLGLREERKGWKSSDYAAALRHEFSVGQGC